MDNTKDTTQGIDKSATVPLAYHEVCMTRNRKTLLNVVLCWAISIVLAIGLFTFLWLQYDYTNTTEVSGVYALADSEGNVIASDLAAEDIIRIMGEISNGQNQSD